MFADLTADTAVRADGATPGRYHLTLPDHWDYLMPSGGVVVTAALRAAAAEVGDPALKLVSTTTMFCAPVGPGPVVADVVILRRGGATTQVRVALRTATSAGIHCELSATFMRDRKGPDVRGVPFPAVRSVADALPVEDGAANNPHVRFRFYQQLECRVAEGDRYWTEGLVAGPARYARWLRYKVPQRDRSGCFDRLALPPLIDTMPTALHRAIGPGAYRFYAPSLDLTTYVVDDTTREWLLVAVTMRRALGGVAIADAEVWDDLGRFIGYGTQAMYLNSLAGDPPTVDASGRT